MANRLAGSWESELRTHHTTQHARSRTCPEQRRAAGTGTEARGPRSQQRYSQLPRGGDTRVSVGIHTCGEHNGLFLRSQKVPGLTGGP